MSKYSIDSTTLTGIANAIRTKDGSNSPISVSDFATKITNIPVTSGDEFLDIMQLKAYGRTNDPSMFIMYGYLIPAEDLANKTTIKVTYSLVVPPTTTGDSSSSTLRKYNLTIKAYHKYSGKNDTKIEYVEDHNVSSAYNNDLVQNILKNFTTSSTLVKEQYTYTIDHTKDFGDGLIIVGEIDNDSNNGLQYFSTHKLIIHSVEVA